MENSFSTQINLLGIPDGTYFICIKTKGREDIETVKVVIHR